MIEVRPAGAEGTIEMEYCCENLGRSASRADLATHQNVQCDHQKFCQTFSNLTFGMPEKSM